MEQLTLAQALLTAFWPVWVSLLGFATASLLGVGRE
jgi:hypothetical protein